MVASELKVTGYGLGPHNYFIRGARMLAEAVEKQRPDTLFYVAFEFRCAIEQTLKVYLDLLNPDGLSKKMLKLYSASDLKKTILDIEPEFVRKLEFVSILVESVGNKGVYQVDLNLLSMHYGKLGNYLHAQYEPSKSVDNSKWWGSFLFILQEIETYLKEILSHDLAAMTMSEKGWDLFSRWSSGHLSREEVQREFLTGLREFDSV
jgi:hypothetical protein